MPKGESFSNSEKIIDGDLLWRPIQKLQKTRFLNIFEIFSPKSGLWRKIACANWKLYSIASIFTENIFLKNPLYKALWPKIRFFSHI